MTIRYAPSFLRELKKLDPALREEVIVKIEEFKKEPNAVSLKVHKLHGKLKEEYGFSINYRIRIRFEKVSGEYWHAPTGAPHLAQCCWVVCCRPRR